MSRAPVALLTAVLVIVGAQRPALAHASEPVAAGPAAAATAAPSPPAPSTPAPAATPAPAPSSAGWDDEPVSPPPPVITAATAPPADLPPPAPRAPTRGKAVLGVGIGLLALGGTSLLLVALPAAAVKRGSMNRAERNDVIDPSTRKQQYRRARIADDTMEAGFWIGISGLVLGTALAITGGVMKSRSRARPAMARIGGGPGGLALRF